MVEVVALAAYAASSGVIAVGAGDQSDAKSVACAASADNAELGLQLLAHKSRIGGPQLGLPWRVQLAFVAWADQ